MFDQVSSLDATIVADWARRLDSPSPDLHDAGRIDLIRALEELKCAAEAMQAAVSADFDASQRADQAARGIPKERQGRGIAAQVALARRESPHRGQQHLGLAKILRDELPHTMAAFRAGRITEWKATIVARETACLSLDDRRAVDTDLASNPERIEAMGDAELAAAAREHAYRLDAQSYVERRRRAEADRRVTLRPAPDVMSQLSTLLPVKAGVAVYAALTSRGRPAPRRGRPAFARADHGRHPGRPSRGQPPGSTRVTLNVVVSDAVLWGEAGAAHLDGYGPIPGDLVRELAGSDPCLGPPPLRAAGDRTLVAMDSTQRLLPRGLMQLIRLRDRRCRTPWCDAPVRHGDHVTASADGGATSEPNTQGLCESCNHSKQAPNWRAGPSPGIRHTVEITTPTGHRYRSTAPPARPPRFAETQPGVWTLVA